MSEDVGGGPIAVGAEVIVAGRDPEKLAAAGKKVVGAEQVDGVCESAVTEFFPPVAPQSRGSRPGGRSGG